MNETFIEIFLWVSTIIISGAMLSPVIGLFWKSTMKKKPRKTKRLRKPRSLFNYLKVTHTNQRSASHHHKSKTYTSPSLQPGMPA